RRARTNAESTDGELETIYSREEPFTQNY
ncbi:hypothetical protein O991_00533, partial [Enterococcus faecium 10/96A]